MTGGPTAIAFLASVLLVVSAAAAPDADPPGAPTGAAPGQPDASTCLDASWGEADMKACLESWSDVQCQILEGAHLDAQNAPTYFLENRYLKTNHYNGVKQNKTLKKWGDIPPDIGVCTDTVIRALRHAGVDLQQVVYKDMKKDEGKAKKNQLYPWGKWKKKKADTNIDHRRCPILETFFQLHALVLPIETDEEHLPTWQPGDIVYWDLETGRYHIGVVSDAIGPSGKPRVFHNFPSPGFACEEDALEAFKIIGHYRYPKPGTPKPKTPLPDGYGPYTGYTPGV